MAEENKQLNTDGTGDQADNSESKNLTKKGKGGKKRKRKATTPSFILELPLVVNTSQARQLRCRFEAGRNLYNALLSEAMRRLKIMRNSAEWQAARALPRKTEAERQLRRQTFKELCVRYEFEEYALEKFSKIARVSWLSENIDAMTAKTLSDRAFKAASRVCFGQAKKVRFRSRGRGLDSLDGNNNSAGIRFKLDKPEEGSNGRLIWNVQLWQGLGKRTGKKKGQLKTLELPAIIDWQDPLVRYSLSHRIKYAQLIRRKTTSSYAQGADCTGYRYYVQLVLAGKPYRKPKNEPGKAVIGLDLGPQTVAIVSQDAAVARLEVLCAELSPDAKAKRRLKRKLDRQRRANNPANYDEKGQIKKLGKGEKRSWKNSKGYNKTRRKIANNERRLASYRKTLHGRLANEVVRAGNTVKLEKINYRGWQKLHGASMGLRAPGMFKNILGRTVARTGGTFLEFSTQNTKLSQVCHNCGTVEKKPLYQRWHKCACGLSPVQRDLYSAWLAAHISLTEHTLSTTLCRKNWEVAEPRLSAVMDRLKEHSNERRTKFPQSVGLSQRQRVSA